VRWLSIFTCGKHFSLVVSVFLALQVTFMAMGSSGFHAEMV